MKVTTVFASLIFGFFSVGMAQAAEAPANDVNVQVASAGHDPYYPQAVSAQSKTRAEVLSELRQAVGNGSLKDSGHNAYYPVRTAK